MEDNEEIKSLLKKYKISYSELLKYITNFSHTTRISEELAKPLSDKRKQIYLNAINKIKQEKLKLYGDN